MTNDTELNDTVLTTTFLSPHSTEVGVTLRVNRDAPGYVLEWTDFVINEWSEAFPTLSTALARLALLAYCAETDWDATFAEEPCDFFLSWVDFAESIVN